VSHLSWLSWLSCPPGCSVLSWKSWFDIPFLTRLLWQSYTACRLLPAPYCLSVLRVLS
jgi:hypothetical protein